MCLKHMHKVWKRKRVWNRRQKDGQHIVLRKPLNLHTYGYVKSANMRTYITPYTRNWYISKHNKSESTMLHLKLNDIWNKAKQPQPQPSPNQLLPVLYTGKCSDIIQYDRRPKLMPTCDLSAKNSNIMIWHIIR